MAAGDVGLVILDVGLPDMSGFEACNMIRRSSEVPILFLTARAEEIDRVVGLEIGADDYVVKPFSPREVAARVRAILKRTGAARASAARSPAAAASADLGFRQKRCNGPDLGLGGMAMPQACYHRLMPRPEIVWAGYHVVRVVEAPSGLRRGALPEQILTLSSCITEFFPDTWALDWVTSSEEDRFDAAAQVGIRGRALPSFVRRMTGAFDASQLGWPNVWLSLDAARQAVRDFLPRDEGVLLGLGVPMDLVERVLAACEPKSGEGPIGLYSALSQRIPLDPTGEPIGWEILGLERGGTYHSWLCNSLHVQTPSSIGEAASGAFGTIASERHARDILATIASDPSIAEPVPWFLGRLFRYSL